MSPPGQIAARVAQAMHRIASEHEHLALKTDYDIDVIDTTHVPPYGYGKTHGYTKIVRLQFDSVLLEVADIIQTLLSNKKNNKEKEEEPSSSLLQQQQQVMMLQDDDWHVVLRQVMRFHCRLSHVAAHTALLTIDTRRLLARPDHVLQQLYEFMLPDEDGLTTSMAESILAEEPHFVDLLQTLQAKGTQFFLGGGSSSTSNQDSSLLLLFSNLNQVLTEELQGTKNMSVWPCPSFWSAGTSAAAAAAAARLVGNDPIPPLRVWGQTVAKALSPNCSDPLNTCFVPRDVCEDLGDAECHYNKKKKKKN